MSLIFVPVPPLPVSRLHVLKQRPRTGKPDYSLSCFQSPWNTCLTAERWGPVLCCKRGYPCCLSYTSSSSLTLQQPEGYQVSSSRRLTLSSPYRYIPQGCGRSHGSDFARQSFSRVRRPCHPPGGQAPSSRPISNTPPIRFPWTWETAHRAVALSSFHAGVRRTRHGSYGNTPG